MNSKLNKAIQIMSKIAEVGLWIGSGITAALVLVLAFSQNLGLMKYFTDLTVETEKASISGFSISLAREDGSPVFGAFMIFFITALIIFVLTALAFRNVNKVFKTAAGSTPFQPEIVKMIKRIGYCIMGIPAAGIVMSVIAIIALRPQNVELDIDFNYIFIGLIVLALSQFFAYGVSLEDDVEGLL